MVGNDKYIISQFKNIMKTKREIVERIKGLRIVKDADLKRIGI